MAAGLGFKTFTTGEVLTAADVNGYLMQGVLVFASAAARNAAITSPQEGQFAFTKDTNGLWYYDGAAWVASGATGDIEGVTAGVGISGGGTSGTVTVTNSMATAIDAKGDLIAGTAADTFDRLAVGTNGQTLVADSSTATGLKWATASAASGPAFRAYPTTDQSIPATTFTKVLFGSETFDTASNFASSTFTPTTAGYYQLNVNLYMAALTASNDSMQIWKNGSNYQTFHNAYSTGEPSFAMGALMYFNGSTDYAEIYFYKGGSGAGTVVSGTTISSFSGVWIRS